MSAASGVSFSNRFPVEIILANSQADYLEEVLQRHDLYSEEMLDNLDMRMKCLDILLERIDNNTKNGNFDVNNDKLRSQALRFLRLFERFLADEDLIKLYLAIAKFYPFNPREKFTFESVRILLRAFKVAKEPDKTMILQRINDIEISIYRFFQDFLRQHIGPTIQPLLESLKPQNSLEEILRRLNVFLKESIHPFCRKVILEEFHKTLKKVQLTLERKTFSYFEEEIKKQLSRIGETPLELLHSKFRDHFELLKNDMIHHENKIAVLKIFSDEMQNLLIRIFTHCNALLGTLAPCQYEFLILGSFTKDEGFPFSDIELAVLIDNQAVKGRYIENFLKPFLGLVSFYLAGLVDLWTIEVQDKTNLLTTRIVQTGMILDEGYLNLLIGQHSIDFTAPSQPEIAIITNSPDELNNRLRQMNYKDDPGKYVKIAFSLFYAKLLFTSSDNPLYENYRSKQYIAGLFKHFFSFNALEFLDGTNLIKDDKLLAYNYVKNLKKQFLNILHFFVFYLSIRSLITSGVFTQGRILRFKKPHSNQFNIENILNEFRKEKCSIWPWLADKIHFYWTNLQLLRTKYCIFDRHYSDQREPSEVLESQIEGEMYNSCFPLEIVRLKELSKNDSDFLKKMNAEFIHPLLNLFSKELNIDKSSLQSNRFLRYKDNVSTVLYYLYEDTSGKENSFITNFIQLSREEQQCILDFYKEQNIPYKEDIERKKWVLKALGQSNAEFTVLDLSPFIVALDDGLLVAILKKNYKSLEEIYLDGCNLVEIDLFCCSFHLLSNHEYKIKRLHANNCRFLLRLALPRSNCLTYLSVNNCAKLKIISLASNELSRLEEVECKNSPKIIFLNTREGSLLFELLKEGKNYFSTVNDEIKRLDFANPLKINPFNLKQIKLSSPPFFKWQVCVAESYPWLFEYIDIANPSSVVLAIKALIICECQLTTLGKDFDRKKIVELLPKNNDENLDLETVKGIQKSIILLMKIKRLLKNFHIMTEIISKDVLIKIMNCFKKYLEVNSSTNILRELEWMGFIDWVQIFCETYPSLKVLLNEYQKQNKICETIISIFLLPSPFQNKFKKDYNKNILNNKNCCRLQNILKEKEQPLNSLILTLLATVNHPLWKT